MGIDKETLMYRGRPASELSKDELLVSLSEAVRLLDEERNFNAEAKELKKRMERWGL